MNYELVQYSLVKISIFQYCLLCFDLLFYPGNTLVKKLRFGDKVIFIIYDCERNMHQVLLCMTVHKYPMTIEGRLF